MKIPGLDALLFHGVRLAHGLGAFQTARRLDPAALDGARGVLVVVTTALGDSITFTPALTALRARFPRARIVGLYHRAYSDLYAADPRFDRVIPYHGKYRRVLDTVRALREEACELALLPYMNDPDVIPLVLAGGSRTLYRMPGRNTLYSFLVVHPELLSSAPPPDHANRRAADMVKLLGCDVTDLRSSLHVPADSREAVDRALDDARDRRVLVGLHPGASISAKRWPVEKFQRLAGLVLKDRGDACFVITGSESDRAAADEIAGGLPAQNVRNLAGRVPIRHMPELLRRLAALVSGDTGIAVMAYAMNCPTVTMFWHTNPSICGPLEPGGRHRVVRGPDAESISPEEVLDEVIRHIRNASHVRDLR